MSDTKHVVVTREGLQRMKEELEYKETTEKMKVAEQLKVAISYGDLSENAEYDAAKNDQAVLEQRITELKAMIENAVVVDESKISTDAVGFGTRVTIVYEDEPDDEEVSAVQKEAADPADECVHIRCIWVFGRVIRPPSRGCRGARPVRRSGGAPRRTLCAGRRPGCRGRSCKPSRC